MAPELAALLLPAPGVVFSLLFALVVDFDFGGSPHRPAGFAVGATFKIDIRLLVQTFVFRLVIVGSEIFTILVIRVKPILRLEIASPS